MKIRKNQYLSTSAVRAICVREDLFTKGTESEYYRMFKMVDSMCNNGLEIRTEDLHAIAEYIAERSDYADWERRTGLGYADFVCHIMFCLYERVQTGFEIL